MNGTHGEELERRLKLDLEGLSFQAEEPLFKGLGVWKCRGCSRFGVVGV